ncbi:MAG: RDD family protein [Candidatus Binatia bacterium]|nr:RDD family protein [Candidatus Binatia bacterium]
MTAPDRVSSTSETHPFPSPWRRLCAAAVDLAFLWAVTELLVAFYEAEFIALGRSGRFIGALFFLAYLGGQNSKLAKGATFGKRLLGLRVVDQMGKSPTLEKSVLRAGLLVVPFFTRGVFVFPENASVASATHVLLALTSFGYGALLIASYLPSRSSGQAFHDRLVGTFVVRSQGTLPELVTDYRASWARRFAATVWLTLCALGSATQWWFWGGFQWNDIVELRARVATVEGVQRAEVFLGTYYFRDLSDAQRKASWIEARVVFNHRFSNFLEQSLQVAKALLATDIPSRFDAVRITVGYEFDLMFATRRWQQSFVRTPAEWRELLSPPPGDVQAKRWSHTRP